MKQPTKSNWFRYALHQTIDLYFAPILFEWGYTSVKVAFDHGDCAIYTGEIAGEHIYTAIDVSLGCRSESNFKRMVSAFRAWKPTE